MELLRRIERYLPHSGVPPTRFGRAAASDPRFVFDLRNGRCPRDRMAARVAGFLDRAEREVGQ